MANCKHDGPRIDGMCWLCNESELRARIEQLQKENEQLRLSLQASAFVQERAKVERLEAELLSADTDNAILRERNSELRKGNSAQAERLSAENAGLREDRERMQFLEGCGFTYETGSQIFCIKMRIPFSGLPLTVTAAVDAARGAK